MRLAGVLSREMPQISPGVYPPLAGNLGQLGSDRPPIGPLLAGVIGSRTLERHAAGVVAYRADLLDLFGAQARLLRQSGQLGALLLDRPGILPGLLDQGGHDALDRVVGEVPLAGELDRGETGPLRDRSDALQARAALRPSPPRPEGAMVPLRQLRVRGHVVPEDAAVVDHPRDH